MAKRPVDPHSAPLSRERTAELLKRLRGLSKEARVLKARANAAEQYEQEHHRRVVRPERSRNRGRS